MIEEKLYVIRTVDKHVDNAKGKHYYFSGSGMWAVPKLYKIGDAKRVLRKENKWREARNSNPHYQNHEPLSMVEAVPVTCVLGEPTNFEVA